MYTSSYRVDLLEFRGLLVVRDALGARRLWLRRRLSWRYAIDPLCCATELPRRNGDHNAGGLELNVLTLALLLIHSRWHRRQTGFP